MPSRLFFDQWDARAILDVSLHSSCPGTHPNQCTNTITWERKKNTLLKNEMQNRTEQKSLLSLQSAYNEISSSNSSGVSNDGVWSVIYSNWEPFKNVPVFRCGFKPLIHTFTIILSAKANVYCSIQP